MSLPKVLLVDDEAGVLSAFQRLLRGEPYELVVTTSPEDAFQKIAQEMYAVVISDHRLPGIEGAYLLERMREVSPETVRIILTGYADTCAAIEAINRGAVYRLLTKPWHDDELRLTVRQAVLRFELIQENKRLHALTQKQNADLKDLNQSLEAKIEERTREISLLHEQLEKSFLETVQVLVSLAEMHSTVVGNHSKRVATLAREIGERLGMRGKDLFELEIAATLHDVGKVAVPPGILEKADTSLTPADKQVLRRHVAKGEAIVKMVTSLDSVSLLIRHHHECFDGKGFPDGLEGKDIPLGSRIIAVADAFDKALNGRATFDSSTPQKALIFVQNHAPADFDPDIVGVLANRLSEESRAGQEQEVEIRLKDLRVGMVLSRDLRTVGGVLLLSRGNEILENYLVHILNFQETDPVVDSIYVHRQKTAPTASGPAISPEPASKDQAKAPPAKPPKAA
ncbi:MAG: HD domain-containing protein [Verrucomicrobia bacterium]|nr:HD domain-containing protein [Verrucomicrobiota bacterium]